MAKILIVDDDPIIRTLFSGLFAPYKVDVTCLLAENGFEALKILQSEHIDLIISDLHMPYMDGFQLLANLMKDFPNVRIILMTSFGGPEVEDKLHKYGDPIYLKKPINGAQVVGQVLDELSLGAQGEVSGFELSNFVQLVSMDKKTCTLTVRYDDMVGYLYFSSGQLVEAEIGNMGGFDAAIKILGWNKPIIQIRGVCNKTKTGIEVPLEYLIVEAMRLKLENI